MKQTPSETRETTRWTREEWAQVAQRAAQLKTESTDTDWVQIAYASQDVLPMARRRYQLTWHGALTPMFDILGLDESGEPRPVAPVPAPEAPVAAIPTDAPVDLKKATNAALMVEILSRSQVFIDEIKGVYTIVSQMKNGQAEMSAKMTEWEQRLSGQVKDAQVELGQVQEQMKSCEELVMEEMAKLSKVTSTAAPAPVPEPEPEPETNHDQASSGDKPRLDILLVGPRPEDFQHIQAKLNGLRSKVELNMLDKRAAHVPAGYDYVMVSQKFAQSLWPEAHRHYGKRAISVAGGNSQIIMAIEGCVRNSTTVIENSVTAKA